MDSNGDGSGLTYWTIALIMAATLFLVYVIKRFRACRKRANERHAAEAARDARFHALALMPRNQVDRLNDRLEELDININERQAPPQEAPRPRGQPPAETPKALSSPRTRPDQKTPAAPNFNHANAVTPHLQPVSFKFIASSLPSINNVYFP